MRFFTFRRAAVAARKAWQTVRFLAGKGYFLVGRPPIVAQGEAKNDTPFNRVVNRVLSSGYTTMYDSIDISQIPADAKAVAGYVGGKWPTFWKLAQRWPKANRVSVAVFASEDAECLDVELGDATVSQAPAWVRRQQKRGIIRPIVYTSADNAPALLKALAAAGIRRSEIRLWTAHYTNRVHLCGASCCSGLWTTADATQWWDRAYGRNLDVSICSPSFFK